MKTTAAPGAPPRPSGKLHQLPTGLSLGLLASIIVSFLAASAAPTPLYATYATEWGFSPITTTVVFGVYALAVLAALLVLGRVSDHVGRRPVLFSALGAQTLAMVVFATAAGVPSLLAGRVLQGVATGAALGAIGAGMLDLDRERGTIANAVAPGTGTALGALASGFIVQFLPAPTHLVYVLLAGLFVVQAVGVGFVGETARREPGAARSLVPELRLPRPLRRPVLLAAPVLFAVWALAGFYGSLGPSLVAGLAHSNSEVFAGLSLFVLAGVAALSGLIFRQLPARAAMNLGIGALLLGTGGTLLAISIGSTIVFFLSTAVSGVGFGSGFQGGIRTVVPLAAPEERAGVLSILYGVSYLGMGVPAVIAGDVFVHLGSITTTARGYAIALVVLAAASVLGRMPRTSRIRREAACPAAARS